MVSSNEACAQETPSATATSGPTVEEIVVTAQRRSENLQNVPISVTAITGAALRQSGINSFQELTNVTPGLVFARSTANAQPTIRGIGTRNAQIGDEPNVALYVDGVYQPIQSANNQDLVDIDRVEVLKGPQGTLFGRNATGGAINIITKRPSYTPSADATFTYGRFDFVKGTLYATGPIVRDRLAASIGVTALQDDGYIDNIYLNRKQGRRNLFAIRGKLLWQPSDNFDLTTSAFFTKAFDDVTFSARPLNGNTSARRSANPAAIPENILVPKGDFQTSENVIPEYRPRQWGVSSTGNLDLGFATFTALASFQETHTWLTSDTDVSPLQIASYNLRYNGWTYTQQAYLASPSNGRFRWIVGAEGFQDRQTTDPSVQGATRSFAEVKTRSYAAFGEVTYGVTDSLFLTGGLRYTHDRKSAYFQRIAPLPVQTGSNSFSNGKVTPRAVLRYEFSPVANAYFSFSQGYKSASYNASTVAGASVAARPENIDAYELGFKSTIDGWLRLNGAAFYYDYTDLQVTVANTTVVNGVTQLNTALQNAPSARSYGLELSADAAVATGLRLNAGLSLLRTKITDFPNASVTIPNPATIVNGYYSGNLSVSRDVAGNQLIRAPRFTLNLGSTYSTELDGGKYGRLDLSSSILFSSRFYTDIGNRLFQPAYRNANASITWHAPGDHWRLTLFGQNLTDDRQIAQIFTSALNDNVAYLKPRWFGATIGAGF
nr:TonB-dependent receptor [Sphingobium sp. Sx8-8]